MKPAPWSYTALDDFVNCPRSFHAKRVIKIVKDEGGPHLDEGVRVHKAFELRIGDGTELPPDLARHEWYMQTLERYTGAKYVEKKVALNMRREPCGFFDKDVWWRGVLDFHCIHPITPNAHVASVVDYKTGKPHKKFKQLKLFALYLFAQYPTLTTVTCTYYWTQTGTLVTDRYERSQIQTLWSEFIPDLKQYVEAYRTDTWQPRPSGLCHGWCPLKTCEHWKPKKGGR